MKIIVQNRKIISQGKFPVSKNINAYTMQVEFRDSEGIGWDSLEKCIVFKNGNDAISVPLDGKEVSIPWEVLQNTGNLYITIIGTQTEPYKKIVTEKMMDGIPVRQSGTVDGSNGETPTPSQAEFIMEKAAKAYEISQRLRHDADNGMFDGKDGKSAYIDALTAGYKGTENEFCEGLANMPGHISDKNIHVTAQDKENWDGKAAANPNLLDNWYFKYPINQRGKTTYDISRESAYTIDRWWAIFAGVTVSSDGIVLQSNNTTYGAHIRQALEEPIRFAGRTVTASVLVKNISGTAKMGITKSTGINSGQVNIKVINLSNGLNTFTVTLPNDIGSTTYPCLLFRLETGNKNNSQSVEIIAAKLELGSVQTLAHQENGIWVLNDAPPNKQQELAKCQRYFIPVDGIGRYPATISGTSNVVQIFVPTPVSMRARPGISGSFGFSFRVNSGAYHINSFSVTEILNTHTGFLIIGTAEWKTGTPNVYSCGIAILDSKIYASADL